MYETCLYAMMLGLYAFLKKISGQSDRCKSILIYLTNKTNKFISYHLIISKHRYCRIKLYSFHDLLMHYVFSDFSSILWRLSIASQINGYKIHRIYYNQ
jgi:hypothetical protein